MLKTIVIQNYRSCLRTALDLHPNLSVLIGPNGSGKTNILQAIMLLSKMADEGPHRRRGSRNRASSRIRAIFKTGRMEVRVRASLDTYTDELNNDFVEKSRETWSLIKGRGRESSIDLPLSVITNLGSHYYYLSRGRLYERWRDGRIPSVPNWATSHLPRVAKFCGGIRYYGASQFTNPGSCPVSFEVEEDELRRNLVRNRGHEKTLFNMYTACKAEESSRYGEFLNLVGPHGMKLIDDIRFREFQTSSTEYSVLVGGKVQVRKRKKLIVIPQFRVGRQVLSPNQLSEGTFKTIVLVFHVITEPGSLLLVEEPEVCIHHGLLSSILGLIRSYSDRKQMILSTHSDYVLDHMGPENVYRVSFDKSRGTLAHHIRKTMTARDFSALRRYLDKEGNLGEFWREGGLGDRI